ncbi:glycoside hydrolase family 3 protein [Caproiciproducens sp. MSJ-32]|uniref:glycoside hydrolase family 3 protein n=1 Tax=Caproiciproducens sp. MSJ-32 TaxID=2841527 RepID=UPI001C10A054|nr:glycoside hydrolase family 3 N-terminal domain-containing protein [Caproiciproducens sp. MSJ-32]MBU5453991.1 beta-hexosaminidase [Caproiciproducens sp. MSJ-32]
MKKILLFMFLIIILFMSGFLSYKILSDKFSKIPDDRLPTNDLPPKDIIPTEPTNKEKAEKLLKTMTLEEKVGQMFLVRCNPDTAIEDIQKYHIGGFILFDANIANHTKESLASTIENYQATSDIALLVAVDEEGGTVNRLSWYPEFRAVPFPSPQDLYNEGGFPLIISDTEEKAKLLKNLGINLNLAPVADLSTNPYDFIYDRTFGKDAFETSKYVETVVKVMKDQNIGSTLKHFPGYGNNLDTHTGISIDERSYKNFLENDFLPFKAGIKAGAGSILVSHNIVKAMDENLPASLSTNVNKIIRDELNFDGVVMTDDLQMDAIKEYIGDASSAVLAVQAGNDLIIASNFELQIPLVIEAVKNGEISEERINEAVLRILSWKFELGIL